MKIYYISLCAAAAALLVLSVPTRAAASEGGDPAVAQEGVDEVVVTANRLETERLRVGSTTYTMDAADIELRQYRTVTDVLRTIPGVAVTRSGPFGGLSYVKMRGATSGQTLVLIDGAIMNDPSAPDGAYDFAFLNTDDIERVEVLSGPQSTLYGSAAIGGVINIITKGSKDKSPVAGYAEAGSFQTRRIGVQTAGAGEMLSGRLSVDWVESDGISKADENAGNTEKDAYENLTISGRAGLQVSDAVSFTATARLFDSEMMYDGYAPPDYSFGDADLVAKSKQYSGGLYTDFAVADGHFDNRLGVFYTSSKRDESGVDNAAPDFEGDTTLVSYQGSYELALRKKLLFGAEYRDTRVKDPNGSAPTESLDATGIYGMYQFAPVDSLDLTLGVRNDNYEDYGSKTTGRVTGAWNITNSATTVRSSFGTGFKAPTIYQIGYSYGPTAPLDSLKPETSTGWDIGIEQQFEAASMYVQATYFYDEVEDAITFVELFGPAPGFEYSARYENVDEVRRKGVELVFGGDIVRDLSFRLTGAYVDARNQTTEERLSRVPRVTGVLNFSWAATQGSSVFMDVVAQSDQDDSPYSDVITPGFGVVNLGGSWQAGRNWSVFGRVENLLDKEYQEVYSYGTPDRSYSVGFKAGI